MKLLLTLLFCFSFVFCINSQEFKEVKTAQDVIDNYITANGGLDDIKKIWSVEMSGTMSFMGSTFPMKVYTSYDYFYMNGESSEFTFTTSMSLKEGFGWQNMFGMIKDVPKDEIERNRVNIESMLWTYYTDKDKYGITYKLMQNETVSGNDAYVVDFMAGDSLIQTCYYDTKTFYRVKQSKGKTISEYSDFRNVENSGTFMGYQVKTNQGDVTVTEYKFNVEFDKSLLKKPEGK